MKRLVVSIVAASFAAVVLPHAAAAQCEGGVTVAGFYTRDGSYMPGHCAYTNPTTPGQLYPSGAQPVPSTNPALGASRLPGQQTPSGLLPVNSSDLGPAPSYVNTSPLQGGGVAALGPSVGPGAPAAADVVTGTTLNTTGNVATTQQSGTIVNTATVGTTGAVAANSALPGQPVTSSATALTGLPNQFPQTGLPALNGNRAVPSSLANTTAADVTGVVPAAGAVAGAPGTAAAVTGVANTTAGTTGAVTGAANVTGGTNVNQVNTAYGLSLGAAPPREQTYTGEQLNTVTLSFPNQ
jgi:hypothetical protein